jgi:hypothetical protein
MTTHGNRSPGRWRKSSYNGNCVEIGVVDVNLPVSGWRTSSYTNGGEACVEVGMVDLRPATAVWHKSSHSGNNGECVEIGVVDLSQAPGGWQKSSYSDGNGGDCVEISVMEGGQVPGDRAVSAVRLLVVRDSKDPAGPRLHFTRGAWNTFARDIKDGAFDNLI